jgi:hypothetical protein
MDINKIISIQKYYRKYLLRKNVSNLYSKKIICNNTPINFVKYSKLLLTSDVINTMNTIIKKLNLISKCNYEINSRIILSALMINNYTIELLRSEMDRMDFDNIIIDYCLRIKLLFNKINNNQINGNEYKLLTEYLYHFQTVFLQWKKQDKYRSVQNIIVSYYNRRKHIQHIKNTHKNIDSSIKQIMVLENECLSLLNSIQKISPGYDIENLIDNYETIYINIKKTMGRILIQVRQNFNKAYLAYLIEEFKKNKLSIYNLMLDTNKRLIKICNADKNKLKKYNYFNMLDNEKFNEELRNYIIYMVNIINNNDHTRTEQEKKTWETQCVLLFNDNHYYTNLPILLLDVNIHMDTVEFLYV